MTEIAPLVAIGVVVATTALTSAATFFDLVPAEEVGEEQPVSLRDESTRGNGAFFYGYASGRSHTGGGLLGGK